MAHRPARRVVPPLNGAPLREPFGGNPPVKDLPAGMEPLGIAEPQQHQDANGNVMISNGVYGYDNPTAAIVTFFANYGFTEPLLAFLCFQLIIDHMDTRSPSWEFIRNYPRANLTSKCNNFTINLISSLMITLGNGGFGMMIEAWSASPAMMQQSRSRDFREGALFLQLVMEYWPVVHLENRFCFTYTEQEVHHQNAERWIQNMKKPGKNHGVFSQTGVQRTAARDDFGYFAPQHVQGLYHPHAIILFMINRRTHYNRMRADFAVAGLITAVERNTYASIDPLYAVAANDDAVVVIPAGQVNRLP